MGGAQRSGGGVVRLSRSQVAIERIGDAAEFAAGDVCVDLGRLGAGVAEELLDMAEVDAALEEVSSEAVAEGVDGGVLADAGVAERALEDFWMVRVVRCRPWRAPGKIQSSARAFWRRGARAWAAVSARRV